MSAGSGSASRAVAPGGHVAGALLRLGRVSNLPTVWTDVLAGTVLAGGAWSARTGVAALAMTLLYVGGMYLNDGFDHRIDALERPGRPVPSGAVALRTVLAAGFGMLAAGVLLLAALDSRAGWAGVMLAALIVAYDLHHKGNRFAPVLMGGCRALVFVAAGFVAFPAPSWPVALAGLGALAHVAGLTYAARSEADDRVGRLWPLAVLALPFAVPFALGTATAPASWAAAAALLAADLVAVRWLWRRHRPGAVSRAVALLIAAVSLFDGMAMAGAAGWTAVAAGIAGFGLTLSFQRLVPGT